ncbi:hypothetical protein J6590_024585 [Homalodisca vitripennis]|nr:hypothetical protein J6590_024585 [Homalodisca vitripennis]
MFFSWHCLLAKIYEAADVTQWHRGTGPAAKFRTCPPSLSTLLTVLTVSDCTPFTQHKVESRAASTLGTDRSHLRVFTCVVHAPLQGHQATSPSTKSRVGRPRHSELIDLTCVTNPFISVHAPLQGHQATSPSTKSRVGRPRHSELIDITCVCSLVYVSNPFISVHAPLQGHQATSPSKKSRVGRPRHSELIDITCVCSLVEVQYHGKSVTRDSSDTRSSTDDDNDRYHLADDGDR